MAFQLCNIISFQAVHDDLNTQNDRQDIDMTGTGGAPQAPPVTPPAVPPVTSAAAPPPALVSELPLYLHGTLCTMAFQLCNIMSFQAVHHDLNTPNDPQDIEMTSSEEDVVHVHDTYGTHNSDDDSDDSAPCHSPSHLFYNSDNEYGLDDGEGNIKAPLMLHQNYAAPQQPPDTCPMTSSDDDDDNADDDE
jgi:hypothetical protein